MIFPIKLLALFVLICVGFTGAANKTKYSMNEKFFDTIVNGDLHSSIMSYIACDRSFEKGKNGWFAKKCNVTHGTIGENGQKKRCDLEFEETMATTSFAIHALSEDKTVVVWVDEDTSKPHYLLKFTVVHFPDCTVSEAKIDFENHKSLFNSMIRYENAFVPNHDGSFDVFFENTKLCSNKVCRLTLDAQAKVVKGPTASYEPINRLFDASTELNPIDNSYVVYESRRDDTGRISLIKSDGRVILKETGKEGSNNNDVSTLNDQIRVCSKSGDGKINCELFNAKGESLANNTIDIGRRFKSFTLFNLPNGEFVLETESRKQAHATKVGADGKRIGAVKLANFICKGATETTVKDVYSGNNEICLARMCYSDTHVDIVQKCYNNANFNN